MRGHRQRSRYLVQPGSRLAITLSSDNSRIVVVCVTILRVLCVQRCSVVRVIYCSGWTAPTVGHTPKNQFARRLLDVAPLVQPERPRRMTRTCHTLGDDIISGRIFVQLPSAAFGHSSWKFIQSWCFILNKWRKTSLLLFTLTWTRAAPGYPAPTPSSAGTTSESHRCSTGSR